FKSQFANPIESAGDEKSAELLRKLVYPFILRRTKEQVALELPPRTERVVYTDMDSAQKKFYNQTRERYRAELLDLIETEGMNNVRFKVLEGLLRLRQIAIHQIPFFLISLKAGGVGLNLTAADYVIHLDPWWNPAVEMQASDRAHRIGQTKPVFVYKIIARDTVEEKILQLQEKKRALIKNIIATEASFFKSLTQEDVKGLFE
ncbi:MAG: DEAD/DEAH box helicase, partial [Anaerolineales bacterium]|nr:DEAD/DEAH box helicase [Anaerolineales bacterium]